jgi:hypothetical protein
MREPTCRELCSEASVGGYCACDGYPLQVYRRDKQRVALAKATPDPKIFKPEPEPEPKPRPEPAKSVSFDPPPVKTKPKPQKQPRVLKDKRKSISISGETYDKLKARSEVMGISMSSIVSDESIRFLDAEDRKKK